MFTRFNGYYTAGFVDATDPHALKVELELQLLAIADEEKL